MGKDVDKKIKIDDTDIDIIRHLQDGRKSFKRIAEELSLAENTVRSLLGRQALPEREVYELGKGQSLVVRPSLQLSEQIVVDAQGRSHGGIISSHE